MTEIVLMSAPEVAAVPVQECGERLVDVRRDGPLLVDERKRQDSAGVFTYLREGVLDRLLEAHAQLPQGVRLLFVEGYRPPSLQRHYFDRYAAQMRLIIRNGTPSRFAQQPAVTCPLLRSHRTVPARPST